MGFHDLRYEKQGGVAWITINRPEKLNALRSQTVAELCAAVRDADADRTIAVVVLTGAGDKAFCAGGDISELQNLDATAARMHFRQFLDLSTAIRNLGKPFISSVNGYCLGGGNELCLFSDLVIASDRARFGQVGAKIGALPVWGATQLLPRLVGERKAREILFLCHQYTAAEAEAMGLINKVVPHAELRAATAAWCEEILDESPQTLRLLKTSLNFESDLLYASYTHGQHRSTSKSGGSRERGDAAWEKK